MSLRQNELVCRINLYKFSYQSECHCAKTVYTVCKVHKKFSYQSECHCAKTSQRCSRTCDRFSYQSECHCAKTVVAKSPLQGDVHPNWIRDNIRTIKQVNRLLILIYIILN